MNKEIERETHSLENKDISLSKALGHLGKAVKSWMKEMTIGFRHPLNFDAQLREFLEMEIEKEEFRKEADLELIRLEKFKPEEPD